MNIAEQVLAAMNEIDPALLERSEKKRMSKIWLGVPVMAAAAALLIWIQPRSEAVNQSFTAGGGIETYDERAEEEYDETALNSALTADGLTHQFAVIVMDSEGEKLDDEQLKQLAAQLCDMGYEAYVNETTQGTVLMIETDAQALEELEYSLDMTFEIKEEEN